MAFFEGLAGFLVALSICGNVRLPTSLPTACLSTCGLRRLSKKLASEKGILPRCSTMPSIRSAYAFLWYDEYLANCRNQEITT
ncbi:hypothetical protein BU24DRAFT_427141 [Aaosphaeria arxii CBS 175.79]|uniref:Secreted protein n=1 Tax=Aaosphaeria arxii CBS 175.79 TaxID=1450172 RepID=A0A6A5XDJ7_9PLEO|nr:uncharacterized protein BU24DRAFT_427141 [Aaosphaeria arxii CBS 175.79]KAF2010943.1 hypothetical protein BU24DRAFT_427141 [Aaosphaeria arxii CBS 175.79]